MIDDYITITNLFGEEIPVRNIYCVGRNYISHAKELNNSISKEPIIFQKSVSSLTNADEIILTEGTFIHYELEVVVFIKSPGYRIKPENATKYIEGFALGLDLTDRPLQNQLKSKQLPWFLSKNFKNSAIVSAISDWKNPSWNSNFWLEKNGNKVQTGNLKDMIFSVEHIIAYISNRIPLVCGDLIFTGTPEGVGKIENYDNFKMGLGDKTIKSLTVKF